jgi:hypothetical protein
MERMAMNPNFLKHLERLQRRLKMQQEEAVELEVETVGS